MLNTIIEYSVRNKLIVGLLVIALIAVGAYQTTKLPIDAVPDITDNQVQVITQAPAYGATDIERLVTFPIEQANSNIAGIKEIRSFSRFGLSLVTIVFNDDIDIYWARQQVSERLLQIQNQIPQGIGSPELGPISTGLGEIYQYVVKPKKGFQHRYDAVSLRTIQDWIVRRQLLSVKGVAEVSSFGGKLKQYEIAINPNKLNAFGITINDVFDALQNNNQNTGGAYIEKGPTVLYIRSEGLIKNTEDLKNIAIQRAGTPIFLRDIADIQIGNATRYGAICYNDEGEVAGAIVMMLKGANSSEVIKNVKERIAQIQKTLPEGVEIEPFLDRTKMVNNAIGTVQTNLLEGALIVVFVLVLFLGNFRAGFLVASVIPLAMLFAVCMMNLFGVSGNLMSLGALDFGLIVDGAVIIVEAVMHQIHYSKTTHSIKKTEIDELVITSSKKMMNSAVFGQIIILIVYLPIFALEGIEGKMFKPMAQTVAFALLGAFILSLTYIPMMSAFFLSKKKHAPNLADRVMQRIEVIYEKFLLKALDIPKIILSVIFFLFITSIIILSLLGGEFIPALEEGDFAVDTRVLTGSNLNTTIEYTQKTAHILKTKFPEVEKVVTKIGSGEVPTDPMPMEAADMMVILKDKKEWTSAKTFDELAEKMSKELAVVPGVTTGFQYPVQMRFNELMTGARQDVVCKIFGENLDTLSHYAHKLGNVINKIDGAKNLYVETVTGIPQITIEYNRPMIAQYNLSIADINKVVNIALAGQSTGLIFEDEKRFDLVVRLSKDVKQNVQDIQNLLIPTLNGLQIPLSQLADVQIKEGVNQIQREDAKRRIVVGFNVGERDVQSIVKELQQKVNTQIKFPSGYFITYGGAFENLEQAKNRLMIAVPISLLLIFLLLYFAFKNIKQGLLIYTAIPLSAIGGILFLAIRQMPFSISAGVGFIALFGVAVLNGIVLISEFNRLKNEGVESLKEIVIKGTKLRLRPVLMTAFVASLGFLPMALSNGSGAEVQRPLATVVIGGLLIATFLTLFVLPILYIVFENGISGKKNKIVASALVFGVLVGNNVNAQTPISLQNSIEIALKNNSEIKLQKLKSDYLNALIATSKEISKTSISTEWGQLNSPLFDTKIGVNQSISLPIVYQRQRELFTTEYEAFDAQIRLREFELKKAITQAFYQYQFLKNKGVLLLKIDSLYNIFYQKAALRLQKGESNILEKMTAENQKNGVVIQLKELQKDLAVIVSKFRFLLNTPESLTPAYNLGFKTIPIDTLTLNNHPVLKIYSEQIRIIQAQTNLEIAKLKPELNFGLNNTSFRGVAANNETYTARNRFTSAQIGVLIPIFTKAQKAKIEANKIAENVAQTEVEIQKKQFQNEMGRLLITYQNEQAIVENYQNIALKNAQIIKETAIKQFNNGEINYLDLILLLNQSISIEAKYLDAIHSLNQTVIELNYLMLK